MLLTIKLYTHAKLNYLYWNYLHENGYSVKCHTKIDTHKTKTTNRFKNVDESEIKWLSQLTVFENEKFVHFQFLS